MGHRDRDVEGTTCQWGIKITPPNTKLAPYYLTFASKDAAMRELSAITDLPCELTCRSVATGPWRGETRNPVHTAGRHVVGRDVDAALTIYPLMASNTDFAFDAALGDLNGAHPPVINQVSDRAYYFLEGSARVTVGECTFDVGPGDLVTVPAGSPHAVAGTARYLVITAPPFDPRNERPANLA